MSNPRILVALDFAREAAALAICDQLDPGSAGVKIGKELFTRAGPSLVRRVVALGFNVFLDLKFHDIPNTVAGAVRASADLGVWMLNVHASGGAAMLHAAVDARGVDGPLVIGVTVLTSLDDEDMRSLAIADSAGAQAIRLARLAHACGLDGVVCSPKELAALRQQLPGDFLAVTPGIRPAGAAADDQKRTMSPDAAMQAGADYLVIGRPITAAAEPMQALADIAASIRGIAP